MRSTLVLFLMNVLLFNRSRATGTVSVLLSSYNNSKGLESNGNCCEGIKGICNGGNHCDHYFIVCLDRSRESNNDINQCDIGTYTTGTIDNRNKITFGSSIGSTPNPKELQFQTWLDIAVVKVKVWDDDDGNKDDPVDLLITTVNMEASRNRVQMEHRSFTVKRRTQLDFKLGVFCDENWYLPHCDIYCNPSLGNYSCGSKGEKVCHHGLTGENCTQTIINCTSEPCFKPGGKCVNKKDGYICECSHGYTGCLCETEMDASSSTTANSNVTGAHESQTGSVCETEKDDSSSTTANSDVTGAHESQTGNSAKVTGITLAVVLAVVFVVAAVLIAWKIYQRRQKPHNELINEDYGLNNDDLAIYYVAEPVQPHHVTEDNIYYNDASGDARTTSDTDASTKNNTSGNTLGGGKVKTSEDIDVTVYTNAICVNKTGDVYATVNK